MAKNAVKLGRCLAELDEKRRGVREKAITTMVGILTTAPSHKFIEEKCTTIYCQCLTRLATEKKSSKFSNIEVKQAVRALSLLAISLVDEDQTFEVYEECLVVLSGVLDRYEVYDVDTVVEVLGCLGMLGVSGARSSMEMDKGIMVVWKFIMDNDCDDNKPKLPPAILASAIRAWSFLLAGLCRWNLSYKYCKAGISYLSNIVEGQDCEDVPDCESDCDDVTDSESDCDDVPDHGSVVLAATDALALIFDTSFLMNFSHESKADEKDYSSLEKEVKAKFNKRNKDVLKYLDQKCAKLSHVFQMKTIKTFLGEKGFASHMHTNENLQRLFESVWADGRKGEVLAPPERDELVLKFYQPQAGAVGVNSSDLLPHLTEKQKKIQKRMLLSSSSNLSKARTQLLTKQRQLVSCISFETEYFD